MRRSSVKPAGHVARILRNGLDFRWNPTPISIEFRALSSTTQAAA
jgi:hypothetical protein